MTGTLARTRSDGVEGPVRGWPPDLIWLVNCAVTMESSTASLQTTTATTQATSWTMRRITVKLRTTISTRVVTTVEPAGRNPAASSNSDCVRSPIDDGISTRDCLRWTTSTVGAPIVAGVSEPGTMGTSRGAGGARRDGIVVIGGAGGGKRRSPIVTTATGGACSVPIVTGERDGGKTQRDDGSLGRHGYRLKVDGGDSQRRSAEPELDAGSSRRFELRFA